MESRVLKTIKFMTQSQYENELKEDSNLYMVEFQPDLSMFPDYSAGITINHDTTYKVGSGALENYTAGWFRIGLTSISSHGRAPQLYLYINGQKFNMNYGCGFTMVYLTTGNSVKYKDNMDSNSWSKVNAKFFPVKE